MIFVTTNGTRAIADAAPADDPPRNPPQRRGRSTLPRSFGEGLHLSRLRGRRGRFNVEDFLGAATVLSRMDVDDYRLNDGALLALDFAERHEENVYETLKRSRRDDGSSRTTGWTPSTSSPTSMRAICSPKSSREAPTRHRARKVRRRRQGPEPGREDMSETIEIREGEGLRPRSDRALSAGTRR